MTTHKNVADALTILEAVGLPPAQQNELSALCLLAILDLGPKRKWKQGRSPLMGITPIINWIANNYGKRYAPNTRETIRKVALHAFVNAGLAVVNPDKPDRPVNSPNWVYQISREALALVRAYRSREWNFALGLYLQNVPALRQRYASERDTLRIPVKRASHLELTLTPGAHSELIRAIIDEFGAIFVPDGALVYVGDTGSKWGYFDEELLSTLGVKIEEHGIMPDVVIYCRKRNWLLLCEAVVSSGPVNPQRRESLQRLFDDCTAGLVFVTAFSDQVTMRRFIGEIAWETEVWRADAPTHLVHFNGERFLGPYEHI